MPGTAPSRIPSFLAILALALCSTGVQGFVLFPQKVLNKVSPSIERATKGTYSILPVTGDQHEFADEYWEDTLEEKGKPPMDFKESFYSTLDTLGGLLNHGPAEVDLSKRQQEGGSFSGRVMKAKETVYDKIDFLASLPALPGKAWSRYVVRPLQIRKEKARRAKEQRRQLLEVTLQRYYAARNRFYDTLDVISDTTRASVKAVKTSVKAAQAVGKAVAEAPERVTETVNEVQSAYQKAVDTVEDTKQQVVEFPGKVSSAVQDKVKTVENIRDSCVSTYNKIKTLIPKTKVTPPAPEALKAPPKVEEIWESKKEDDTPPPQPIVTLSSPAPTEAVATPPATTTTDDVIPAVTMKDDVKFPVELKAMDSVAADPTTATTTTTAVLEMAEEKGEVVESRPKALKLGESGVNADGATTTKEE